LAGVALAILLAAADCGEERVGDVGESAELAGQTGAGDSGVVATVDGEPITLSEVERVVRGTGLSAVEALRRLIAERLLMREAARRDFGRVPEVADTVKQAAVQRLLAEEVETLTVTEDELEKAYENAADRFHRPELRRSVHVLAALGEEPSEEAVRAARRFAEEAIEAFAVADEVENVLERFRGRRSEYFGVRVERLPLASREGPFVKEYTEALFEPSTTGVVPRPVRTAFGYHAVYVAEIQPPVDTSFKEAKEVLRPEILLPKQRAHLDELIRKLHRGTAVTRNEPVIEWLLSTKIPVKNP
jgi:hypothetical protein